MRWVRYQKNKSIYQLAREELGYGRAETSNLMDGYVPEYHLVKLKDGTTQIQAEDVCAMSLTYNKTELRNHYCTHECTIGKIDVPEVPFKSNIHEILVNIQLNIILTLCFCFIFINLVNFCIQQ